MTFCLFGATGDLTLSKLLPALWTLYKTLPTESIQLVAVSRRDIDSDGYVRLALEFPHLPKEVRSYMADYENFLKKSVRYVKADIKDGDAYNALTDLLKKEYAGEHAQPLTFFLALSPDHFQDFIHTAQASRLGHYIKESQAAVMLEKPFGESEVSARTLEEKVCAVMADKYVYRVDHYLAKPAIMRLAILAEEGVLAKLMQAVRPAALRIRLFETHTIRDRGAYYDHYGVLGDVIQNHALQMVAVFLSTLSTPSVRNARHEEHQTARAGFLKHLSLALGEDAVRIGQYDGYRTEKNVHPDSTTATYARIVYDHHTHGHRHTIIAEAGKALHDSVVTITLEDAGGSALVTFEIQPNEKILVADTVRTHIPKDVLQALSQGVGAQKDDVDAYATLFRDATSRNAARFVSFNEITAAWKATDRAREQIKNRVPKTYPIGWQPE